MNNIACVIVTYNPEEGIKECFNSLVEQVEQVYIVDNGSSESSLKVLSELCKDYYDKVNLIRNNENLGIATALNIGIKEALKNNFSWILTMDQDSKIDKDMINTMINTYYNINENERKDILSIFPNFIDRRIQTLEENRFNDEYEYVDAEITSGNLLKKEVFDKVGFFDDTLFIDLVDTDFCMRLNEKNIKMIKVRDAILYHSLGESQAVKSILGRFNTSNHSATRRYYMTRNRFYTWKKYEGLDSFTLNRDKKLFKKEFVKIIIGEADKVNKVKMILKGYKDYKKGIRGKLK